MIGEMWTGMALTGKAIIAILVSLFAIVLYIRARFAEYSYGFAAVAAVVHDVLITLGVLAICLKFDLLGTEISLPMIAAFLTIIGYSLNDTIVVFDRVRENLPRMEGSLSSIIDRSINQCLSRTLLTSLTTFCGLLPMIFETSIQARFLIPMAISLGYGVLFATVIILGLVPSFYLMVEDALILMGFSDKSEVDEEASASEEGEPTVTPDDGAVSLG